MNNMYPKWKHPSRKKTADIESIISAGFLISSVDFSSAAICAVLLGWFCKINFFKEVGKTLKEYWVLIAVNCGALIARVSYKKL